MTKLKPCPFCGSAPSQASDRIKNKIFYGMGCSNELCIIWFPTDFEPGTISNYCVAYSDHTEMLKDWNRRAK